MSSQYCRLARCCFRLILGLCWVWKRRWCGKDDHRGRHGLVMSVEKTWSMMRCFSVRHGCAIVCERDFVILVFLRFILVGQLYVQMSCVYSVCGNWEEFCSNAICICFCCNTSHDDRSCHDALTHSVMANVNAANVFVHGRPGRNVLGGLIFREQLCCSRFVAVEF
jgi:hypothetical protein